jgi:hypothetical protein
VFNKPNQTGRNPEREAKCPEWGRNLEKMENELNSMESMERLPRLLQPEESPCNLLAAIQQVAFKQSGKLSLKPSIILLKSS